MGSPVNKKGRGAEWYGKGGTAEYAEYRRLSQRRQQLMRKYGVSLEDFDAMIANQGGGCAICGATESNRANLFVDHCHRTGCVRGVLCHKCNAALALIDDDPERAEKMAEYLS